MTLSQPDLRAALLRLVERIGSFELRGTNQILEAHAEWSRELKVILAALASPPQEEEKGTGANSPLFQPHLATTGSTQPPEPVEDGLKRPLRIVSGYRVEAVMDVVDAANKRVGLEALVAAVNRQGTPPAVVGSPTNNGDDARQKESS